MIALSFMNKTPSADIIIDMKAIPIDSSMLLKYTDKSRFEELCKTGCPNYGQKWSCPPYSSDISLYLARYPYAVLFLMWCDLDQFNYTKTEYMRVRAANSILKSRMDRILDKFQGELQGKAISNGSCKLCKPCCKKLEKPCKKPDKIKYSLESLGLDVGSISRDFFNHSLLWYQDKKAPAYTSVLSAYLMKEEISQHNLSSIVKSVF